jgi:outer membrane protein OmpA-like peptidoglycan-associated protein
MTLFARITAAAAGVVLLGVAQSALAQGSPARGYATDSSATIWRNNYGECWRSAGWTGTDIPECGGPAPAPAPKPVAAPAPAPAPVAAPAPAPAPAPAAAAAVVAAPVVAAAPRDSDGDGVVDDRDRCPNTIKGARVDANGCEVVTLKGVNFANNSATLTPESTAVLDQAAAGLIRRGDMKVEVAGHTDNRGAAAYNRDLSQRRAEAVRSYLVSKGVNGGNLSARGYGPDSPVADNKTANGRAENRRVELRQLQ